MPFRPPSDEFIVREELQKAELLFNVGSHRAADRVVAGLLADAGRLQTAEHSKALSIHGAVYVEEGEDKKGEIILREAKRIDERNYFLYQYLATALDRRSMIPSPDSMKQEMEAVMYYEVALQHDRTNTVCLHNLGQLYLRRAEVKKAAHYLGEEMRFTEQPPPVHALIHYGMVLSLADRHVHALTQFKYAETLGKTEGERQQIDINMRNCYRALGDLDNFRLVSARILGWAEAEGSEALADQMRASLCGEDDEPDSGPQRGPSGMH